MLKPSLNELKQIAKTRGIKGYKSMSEERLISSINESEPVKESEINCDDARLENIKKDFNKLGDRISKSKIKEIRKDLFGIEKKKIKEIEKNLVKLEKNLSKLKKYYDYDDIEYTEIRDVRNSFNLSVDEDYYKPIKTNDAFNRNYSFQLNMKVKEIRTKLYKLKNILI